MEDSAFAWSTYHSANISPAHESRMLGSLDDLSQLLNQSETDSTVSLFREFHPTSEQIREEMKLLHEITLSPELEDWIDRYSLVGDRNRFLWTWCHQGVELTTLPSVELSLKDRLYETKVLGVMFDVLLDDVADRGGDIELLEEMLSIPNRCDRDWSAVHPLQKPYVQFAQDVWQEIVDRVGELPRHEEFSRILKFDYAQLFNAMRYAHLLNHFPCMLNLAEHDLYLPHNMHMIVSSSIDLMASPDFSFDELGQLREAVWHAQYMGRIGNLVTTWQREIGEGDFTSGVFAHLMTFADCKPNDLKSWDVARIEKMIREGGHEEYFLQRWQAHRQFLIQHVDRIESLDLKILINGLERLICLHLGSRGKK